ncbi:hypothetical protein OIU77_024693 [Salix suchowensis]|uniref:Uncharacterized protein n=1 Tax=Salix suchowensis TaxID=1278906 RepID=A0ABQ9BUB6_9ROSI|nr:hypothetical protein OIU77_024693 [Salix suchowensis]
MSRCDCHGGRAGGGCRRLKMVVCSSTSSPLLPKWKELLTGNGGRREEVGWPGLIYGREVERRGGDNEVGGCCGVAGGTYERRDGKQAYGWGLFIRGRCNCRMEAIEGNKNG